MDAGIDPQVAEATLEVARHVGKESEEAARAVESDLLRHLRGLARETERSKMGEERSAAKDLKELFGDIKVSTCMVVTCTSPV